MSTENVESIPSVIINQESEQSPNKSNRSIKSSRSISPSLSYREKVTKEINESKMETIAEIANLFDIFANDQNNKSKERDNLVNAQLITLHDLITSNITSTFTNITSTKPSLERRSANLERPDLSNELLDTYNSKSGVFEFEQNNERATRHGSSLLPELEKYSSRIGGDSDFISSLYAYKNKNLNENKSTNNNKNRRASTDMTSHSHIVNALPVNTTQKMPELHLRLSKITPYYVLEAQTDVARFQSKTRLPIRIQEYLSNDVAKMLLAYFAAGGMTEELFYSTDTDNTTVFKLL